MNCSISYLLRLVVVLAGLAPLGCLAQSAPPPELTALPPIDLSPGADVTEPGWFASDRANHRLFVGNAAAVKMIDTTSNVVIAGSHFGWYGEPASRFIAWSRGVIETSGSARSRLYVVGGPHWDSPLPSVLRILDIAGDINAGEAVDIALPFQGARPFPGLVVNPSTRKAYVSTQEGEIFVVDVENRSVIKTLNPDAGSFLALDPVANKIFVLGRNGGAIIDGTSDAVTAPPQPLAIEEPKAAVFNEVDNRLYIAARAAREPNGLQRGALFVLDGKKGELVGSITSFGFGDATFPLAVAVVPGEDTLYLGSGTKIYVVNAADLTVRGELPHPGIALAWDTANPNVLYATFRDGSDYTMPDDNVVRVIDRTSGAFLSQVTTAYRPRELALNAQTKRAYFTDNLASELLALDLEQRTVIARIPLPGPPDQISTDRTMAVSERLNRVYVSRLTYPRPQLRGPIGSWVDVVDGTTNQVRTSFQAPLTDIAVDDTRRRLYLSRSRTVEAWRTNIWELHVYDLDSETFITSIDASQVTSGGPGTMAVNEATGRIYMLTGHQISVVDADTLTRVTDIAIPSDTRIGELVVNTKTNKIYVGGKGHVTVIDGTTNSVENTFKTANENGVVINLAADEEADVVYLIDNRSSANTFQGSRVAMFDGSNGNAFLGERPIGDASTRGLAFRAGARQLLVGVTSSVPNSSYQDANVGIFHVTGRSRLANLSTRMRVGTGESALISGLIVSGPEGSTKRVMLRAIGPSLQRAGIGDALNDTTLELVDAAGNSLTNDNWKINDASGAFQQAELERTGLAPTSDAEAALVAELAPGAYTVAMRGKAGTTGTGLAEVYDLELNSAARLANIATRGHVGSGDAAMIGGMIVNGFGPSRVLIRAIGPSLSGQLAGVLQDPVLELRNVNGDLLDSNDDWKSDHEAAIASTTIPPSHERESALVAGLFPGNYTAVVRGKGDATGIALVEAYYLQ